MSRNIRVKSLQSAFARFGQPDSRLLVRRGFTLMELMVTLTILTVLTLLAAPSIRVDTAEGDATAYRVRAAMQNAQRLALVQQMNIMVSFDTVNQRIRIVEDVNDDKIAQTTERTTYRPLESANFFIAPVKRVGGLTTTASIFGNQLITRNGMPTVVFRRDGSLSSDLEIYTLTRRNGKDSRRAILVSMATGRVDWYKHLGGATWRQGGI